MFLSLVVNYIIAQGYMLYEKWGMGLFGNGVISSFQYSVLIVTSIISILAYPMINLIWPKFLEQEHSENRKLMIQSGINAALPMMFILTVVCIFIFNSAEEIITILFYRGEFDLVSLELTARALYLTIFAALPISIYTLGLRLIMSQGRSALVATAGTGVGIIGIFIIYMSLKLNSVYLLQSHWLISNSFGALFIVLVLIRESEQKLSKVLASVIKPILVLAISITLVLYLPDFYRGPSSVFLAFSLMLEIFIYLFLILSTSIILKIFTLQDIKKTFNPN
jgi:putative peptidoglycan lipid II flippase